MHTHDLPNTRHPLNSHPTPTFLQQSCAVPTSAEAVEADGGRHTEPLGARAVLHVDYSQGCVGEILTGVGERRAVPNQCGLY